MTNKLSKKIIIIIFLIMLVIVGLLAYSISSNSTLSIKFKKDADFMTKALKKGESCLDSDREVSLARSWSGFNKNEINKGINSCNKAYLNVKSMNIPMSIDYNQREILKQFRNDLSNFYKYKTVALEHLLKTDGRTDANLDKYYDNEDFSRIYFESANSYTSILQKKFVEEKLGLNVEWNSSSITDNDSEDFVPTDLKKEDEFASKVIDNGKSCFYLTKEIDKSIKKSTFNKVQINKGIVSCKEASLKIKDTPFSKDIYNKHKVLLKNFRDDMSNACKYLAVSYEYLLKTDGQTNGDINYHNFLDNSNFAMLYIKSANSYRLILKKQYTEEKYRLK